MSFFQPGSGTSRTEKIILAVLGFAVIGVISTIGLLITGLVWLATAKIW